MGSFYFIWEMNNCRRIFELFLSYIFIIKYLMLCLPNDILLPYLFSIHRVWGKMNWTKKKYVDSSEQFQIILTVKVWYIINYKLCCFLMIVSVDLSTHLFSDHYQIICQRLFINLSPIPSTFNDFCFQYKRFLIFLITLCFGLSMILILIHSFNYYIK